MKRTRLEKGMLYVFCGDGKGKTSASLGVMMRMAMIGGRVCWISWFKEKAWKSAEMEIENRVENIEMHWMGKGFWGGPLDHDTPLGHKKAGTEAFLLAKAKLKEFEGGGGIGKKLLVLDEVLRAVEMGVVRVNDLLDLVKQRGATHVILSGKICPPEIASEADLVTEMKKIKHPYDAGRLAVFGLDF